MSDLAQWWQEQEAIEREMRYKLPEDVREVLREMERERNLSRSAWWRTKPVHHEVSALVAAVLRNEKRRRSDANRRTGK